MNRQQTLKDFQRGSSKNNLFNDIDLSNMPQFPSWPPRPTAQAGASQETTKKTKRQDAGFNKPSRTLNGSIDPEKDIQEEDSQEKKNEEDPFDSYGIELQNLSRNSTRYLINAVAGDEVPEEVSRWVLLPTNTFVIAWDYIVIVLLLYTIVFLPWRVAFSKEQVDSWDIAVDSLFVLDMILTFFMAYEDGSGKLVTDHKSIARNYLKQWFALDVVATFPFYLLDEVAIGRLSRALRVPRLFKMIRLVRMLKLLRTYRFQKLFMELEYHPRIHQGTVRIIKLVFLIVAFGHSAACIWYFIGDVENQEISWINRTFDGALLTENDGYKYSISLYWAMTTLTTVGFGDVTAQTQIEALYTVLLMVIGATVFSYITATVSSIISAMDERASVFRSKMHSLHEFVRRAQLSDMTRHMVSKRMSAYWRRDVQKIQHWSILLDEMPVDLILTVLNELYAETFENSSFFERFEDQDEFRRDLITVLRPLEMHAGEFLGHAGEASEHWFLIVQGRVAAVSSIDPTHIYKHYFEGDSIGEIEQFITHSWMMSVRCMSNCRFLVARQKDFFTVVSRFKGVGPRMLNLAKERLDELIICKSNNPVNTKDARAKSISTGAVKTLKGKKSLQTYSSQISGSTADLLKDDGILSEPVNLSGETISNAVPEEPVSEVSEMRNLSLSRSSIPVLGGVDNSALQLSIASLLESITKLNARLENLEKKRWGAVNRGIASKTLHVDEPQTSLPNTPED